MTKSLVNWLKYKQDPYQRHQNYLLDSNSKISFESSGIINSSLATLSKYNKLNDSDLNKNPNSFIKTDLSTGKYNQNLISRKRPKSTDRLILKNNKNSFEEGMRNDFLNLNKANMNSRASMDSRNKLIGQNSMLKYEELINKIVHKSNPRQLSSQTDKTNQSLRKNYSRENKFKNNHKQLSPKPKKQKEKNVQNNEVCFEYSLTKQKNKAKNKKKIVHTVRIIKRSLSRENLKTTDALKANLKNHSALYEMKIKKLSKKMAKVEPSSEKKPQYIHKFDHSFQKVQISDKHVIKEKNNKKKDIKIKDSDPYQYKQRYDKNPSQTKVKRLNRTFSLSTFQSKKVNKELKPKINRDNNMPVYYIPKNYIYKQSNEYDNTKFNSSTSRSNSISKPFKPPSQYQDSIKKGYSKTKNANIRDHRNFYSDSKVKGTLQKKTSLSSFGMKRNEMYFEYRNYNPSPLNQRRNVYY